MNLLESLQSSIKTFLRQSPTEKLLQRVMVLRERGKSAEVLRLMETDAHLEPDDYKDKQRLTVKLHQRLDTLDIDTAAMYLVALASTLDLESRQDDALAVLEVDAHLETSDYKDAQTLTIKLTRRHEGWDPLLVYLYWLALGKILAGVGHQTDALFVMETYVGIEPADYDNLAMLGKKMQDRLDPLPSTLAVVCVMSLSLAQRILGRESLSAKIVRAYLGIEPEMAGDRASFVSAIRKRVQQLPKEAAIVLASILLFKNDVHQDEAIVLESIIGLEAPDYKNKPLLVRKLRTTLHGVVPVNAAMLYMAQLVILLNSDDRPADALAVLEADIGLEESDYQDAQRLASRLRMHLGPLAGEVSGYYLGTLVVTLAILERYSDAMLVQEVDAGLVGADYANAEELAARLKQRLQPLTAGSGAGYVLNLINTLDAAGSQEKASHLIDCYMNNIFNLHSRSEEDHSLVYHLCALADYWLRYHGASEQERTLSFCQQIIPYLRRNLAERGITLGERVEFIEDVSDLRRRVVEIGHHWADQEQDEQQARRLQLTTLLWDTELSQRSLWERFLLSQLDEPVPPATPPGVTWPCLQKQPATSTYLPRAKGARTYRDEAAGAEAASFLEEGEDGGLLQVQQTRQRFQGPLMQQVPLVLLEPLMQQTIPASSVQETALKRVHPDLFERGTTIVQQGVDEQILAHALGPHSLLLRATFDAHGRLVWTAVTSDGNTLSIANYDSGHDGAQEKLRWIVARYDLRCQMIRLSLKNGDEQKAIVDSVSRCVDYLRTYLKWVWYGCPGSREGRTQRRYQLRGVIQNMINRAVQERWPGLDIIETCYSPLLQAPVTTEAFVPWVAEALAQLQELFEVVAVGPPPARTSLEGLLNAATKQYLEEVAALWSLDKLAAVLTPQMDVVLQVDDVLHAIPMAHIQVAGRPLYQYVRSVRTSISLLLTMLQQEAERKFLVEEADSQQLLVVSWFDEGDRARDAAKWLHHGHFVLAKDYAMTCYAASDDPPGTLGAVSAALASGKIFRVVTICGHGNRHHMGIKLRNDRLWDGGGCDLSKVGWLLMVSCSIGRLAQSGERDVEGFCVKLALHRALSVLACRWTVNSLEACTFANEVVQRYLRFHKELDVQDGVQGECSRARALNDARKYFLGDGDQEAGYPHVGLNTIGAFELYGIG